MSPARAAPPHRPTPAEVQAAAGRTVRDVIAPGLAVLFCGINPGLYSGAVGHHFARPGNRFWPALHLGGFTPRQLLPDEERELLKWSYGITNLVARATTGAAELGPDEYVRGGQRLVRKLRRYRPRCLAVLGIGAYRAAFGQPQATLGPQPQPLAGCPVWVLPNPSGLNAHFGLKALAEHFAALRAFAGELAPR